jgi:glutamyl/glutaminyl-tRNA synthetase
MSVAELKAKGYLPEAILNYLALLGWSPPGVRETIEISTLIEKFELPRVSRGSAIFDWAKLNHINQYYITQLSDEDYLKKAKAFLSEGKFDSNNIPGDIFDKTLIAVRSNIETLSEIPTWITLLLGEPQVTSAEGLEVYKIPESRKVLQSMLELMQNSPEVLASQDYDHLMEAVKKQTKIKGKKLFMPIRVALTGGTEGPELVSLITSLGKTKVLERINRGIENLQQPGSN